MEMLVRAAIGGLVLGAAAGCGPTYDSGAFWARSTEAAFQRHLGERDYETARRQASEEELAAARRSAENDREEVARRARLRAEVAGIVARRREAEEAAQRARRSALLAVAGTVGEVLSVPGGLILRLPVDAVFIPETDRLRKMAKPRLDRLAEGLAVRPGPLVRIEVQRDSPVDRSLGPLLALGRFTALAGALRERGLPGGSFLRSPREASPGARVDVAVMEP